jgi:hypothetical protein
MQDRALTSSADGLVCRVFAPPPWAFWRWIRWALLPLALCRIERRGTVVVRLVVEGQRAS